MILFFFFLRILCLGTLYLHLFQPFITTPQLPPSQVHGLFCNYHCFIHVSTQQAPECISGICFSTCFWLTSEDLVTYGVLSLERTDSPSCEWRFWKSTLCLLTC